jgi:hypothetical protein
MKLNTIKKVTFVPMRFFQKIYIRELVSSAINAVGRRNKISLTGKIFPTDCR